MRLTNWRLTNQRLINRRLTNLCNVAPTRNKVTWILIFIWLANINVQGYSYIKMPENSEILNKQQNLQFTNKHEAGGQNQLEMKIICSRNFCLIDFSPFWFFFLRFKNFCSRKSDTVWIGKEEETVQIQNIKNLTF